MSSLGNLLAITGGLIDQASPNGQQGYLSRVAREADPRLDLEAAQTQGAQAQTAQQQQQNQVQRSVLTKLGQLKQQGVSNPGQILSALSQIDPQYAEKSASLQAQNPLAAALSTMSQPATGSSPSQPDVSSLQPESPDDKRNYDFLNTKVPAQYRSLIRQISNGDESVGNADSIRSNGLLALASQFDPSLNKTDFTARQATAKDASSGGKTGQAVTSINTATKHLAQVALAGIDLNNTSYPIVNWAKNAAAKAVGDNPLTSLDSTVQTVAPELAKAAASGGETTQADRDAQAASFGGNLSPKQLLSNVAGKVGLMQSKAEEIANTYKANMGRSRDFINPDNKQTLQDLKDLADYANKDSLDDPQAKKIIDRLRSVTGQSVQSAPQNTPPNASQTGTPDGTVIQNAQGQKMIRKGGKWSPL